MKNTLTNTFGLKLNKNQSFGDLKHDFMKVFELYDAADKTIFYAASNGKGLYRSTDAGENWTSVTDSNGILNSKTVVYKILISNKDPNIIYAAIYQNNRGYIVKSADGGDSFFEIYVAPKIKEKIYAINMDAYNPLLLYMITDQGLFLKSFDGEIGRAHV